MEMPSGGGSFAMHSSSSQIKLDAPWSQLMEQLWMSLHRQLLMFFLGSMQSKQEKTYETNVRTSSWRFE
jgi:hypothetical protein